MSEDAQPERRQARRISFLTEVDISGFGSRRSTDLSAGGIYLEAVTTFPVGTRLRLSFKLDSEDEQPVDVLGRVLYAHETIGFGLAFVDLPPEVRRRIEDLITERLGPA